MPAGHALAGLAVGARHGRAAARAADVAARARAAEQVEAAVVRDLRRRRRRRPSTPDDLEVGAKELLREERQVRERRGEPRALLAHRMDGPRDGVPLEDVDDDARRRALGQRPRRTRGRAADRHGRRRPATSRCTPRTNASIRKLPDSSPPPRFSIATSRATASVRSGPTPARARMSSATSSSSGRGSPGARSTQPSRASSVRCAGGGAAGSGASAQWTTSHSTSGSPPSRPGLIRSGTR